MIWFLNFCVLQLENILLLRNFVRENRDRLHRFLWRILETKWVGDNYKRLVTVWVSGEHTYLNQYRNSVTNIHKLSPVLNDHHDDVTNITVTTSPYEQIIFKLRKATLGLRWLSEIILLTKLVTNFNVPFPNSFNFREF